ncbi:MAG: hypothetical protein HLUCCA12_10085 [Rhodobacteraceae bacterium HLUCCA12]|nr:MAG: hypothetical protein HLUCCA12_10085 [Rhodobacteraceae bacterium HLUCCA12]
MNPDAFRLELDHERRVGVSPRLSVFRRNATAWELLLLLASESDSASDGLYDLVGRVHTDHLSDPALLKFIRDRRKDGMLHFEPHEKRSKWRIRLDEDVLDELKMTLAVRNRLICKDTRKATRA